MWIDDRSMDERRSTLGMLVAVMYADGKIAESERVLLLGACQRLRVPMQELDGMLAEVDTLRVIPAKTSKGRIHQLMDAVTMMLVDGDIDEREMALCQSIAEALGFDENVVPQLIMKITHLSSGGTSRQKAVDQLGSFAPSVTGAGRSGEG
jgi:uncharacterized tellurite resistance protein B-like protein